jgi:ribosome hibernation promoting factor
MRLELTGRHVEITPALRTLVETKLAKVERLLNASAMSAQVVLTLDKHRRRADITVHARGEKFLHGVGTATSWEMSLGQAVDKLAQQVQKVKGKWRKGKRGGRRLDEAAAAPESALAPAPARRPASSSVPRIRMPRIMKASRQALKPMTVADAARELDAGGDGIVVFRDAETQVVSVLVRRGNGEITLVETES